MDKEEERALVRDRRATVGEVFRRLFGDHEAIKFALASNLPYYSDDPETMPFISYAIPQASYLLGGGHYIRGGSQVLSDRLITIIREAGGEAEADREVDAILLNGDSVRGVRHRARSGGDAKEEVAPVVFGNAAPTVAACLGNLGIWPRRDVTAPPRAASPADGDSIRSPHRLTAHPPPRMAPVKPPPPVNADAR